MAAVAGAQNPPLTPTSSLWLNSTSSQGHFAFSHIDIPPGVTVHFIGTYPVQIQCDGDALVRGRMDVDAVGGTDGPGAVTTGMGMFGHFNVSPCGMSGTWPSDGIHRGIYGSDEPFDLAGGSPGGMFFLYTVIGGNCNYSQFTPGGGGGGTLVLEAVGQLTVSGRVSANGALSGTATYGTHGSGGSILLRGLGGLVVTSTAVVQAVGRGSSSYGDGYIRLDSYGQPAVVQGAINPTPRVTEVPRLEQVAQPLRGQYWTLRVAAPAGDGVSIVASFAPASVPTPFGVLGIDLVTAVPLVFLTLPPVVDPQASHQFLLPTNPIFVGLPVHAQAFDWATPLPPRLTNAVHTSVH
ncbi:MAG: hypothetical protein U1E73_04425 [Planctomycetota bacterium]